MTMGDECCGMHLCSKCALPMLIFGIVFILASLKVAVFATLDPWLVVGVFLALLGLMSMMGGKKK